MVFKILPNGAGGGGGGKHLQCQDSGGRGGQMSASSRPSWSTARDARRSPISKEKQNSKTKIPLNEFVGPF